MTITQRLMGVGSWDLNLIADTPRAVMDALDVRRSGFGHIAVTPTPVNIEALSDAGILSVARYTGIYRKQPTEFGLAGCGISGWLGDEDGKGRTFSYANTADGTLAQWVTELRPDALGSGTVTTITGSYTETLYRQTSRAMLDTVCNFFGAEWRVNRNFTLDVGPASTLFDLTPQAVIVRKEGEGGRDFNVVGIVGDLEVSRDVEDWTRQVRYFTGTEASPIENDSDGGVAGIDVPFRDPTGAGVRMDRIIESFNANASAARMADAQYGKYDEPHQELRLSTRQYDIGQDVSVGDNVYVFDPLRGIQDLTTQIEYRGRIIYPEIIRCVGLTWPVRRGMGVYFRYYALVAGAWVLTWLDLTNYIVWEDGDTAVEVGAKPRRARNR